jgi:hypothetical protein
MDDFFDDCDGLGNQWPKIKNGKTTYNNNNKEIEHAENSLLGHYHFRDFFC